MNAKSIVIMVSLICSQLGSAQARTILRCERSESGGKGFTTTRLIITSNRTANDTSNSADSYNYYAMRCEAEEDQSCIASDGRYETFGPINLRDGNYQNDDVSIVRICAGIRIFHDRIENVSFDFKPYECVIEP